MRGSHMPSSSSDSRIPLDPGNPDSGDVSDTEDGNSVEPSADYSGGEAGNTSGATTFRALTSLHLADGTLVSDRLDPLADAARILNDIRPSDAEEESEEDEGTNLNTNEDSESEYWF